MTANTNNSPTAISPELTFDGLGINGPDEYRTRIATFVRGTDSATVEKYGKLFAASPELFQALQNAANVLAALATGQLKSIDRNSAALIQARRALQKATK